MTATRDILTTVKLMPGITSPRLVELLPGHKARTVRCALSTLYKQGKLSRVKAPRRADDPRPHGNTGFAYSINPDPTNMPRAKLTLVKPTEAGLQARILHLQTELDELKAWKVSAIERYPDLAVEPAVLAARKIVIDLYKDDRIAVEDIRSGRWDAKPIVRAALAGLQQAA